MANSMKSLKKKKKRPFSFARGKICFVSQSCGGGKKLVNLMCGLLKTTGDLVSTPYPLLVSDTLSTFY